MPYLPLDEAYKHLGVMQRADGDAREVWEDSKHGLLGKGTRAVGLLGKLRRVTAREYCKVAEALIRGCVSFYGQQSYVSFEQAEQIEAKFRRAFNIRFGRAASTPRFLLYAPRGRRPAYRTHTWAIALSSLYTLVHECISESWASGARAAARSGVALAMEMWGCDCDPSTWCWTHLSKELERTLSGSGVRHTGAAWMLAAAICDKVAAAEAVDEELDPWVGGTARWLWQDGVDKGPLQQGNGHFSAAAGTSVFAAYSEGGLECAPVAELITCGLRSVGHFCTDTLEGESRFATVDEVMQRVDARVRRSPRLKAAAAGLLDELEAMTEPEGEMAACVPTLGGAAEVAEDRRRAREHAGRAPKVAALHAKLESEVSLMGAAGSTPASEWEADIRDAYGYSGGPMADLRGERNPGLADADYEAEGPRLWLVRGDSVEARGGEKGWLRKGDVGVDGFCTGWEAAAEQAVADLSIDEAGHVCHEGGGPLSVDEAAERGPAVEMAVRARLRLVDVPVEHSAPKKSSARRVNVPASTKLLDTVNTWVARIRAQVVYSLDGTLQKVSDGENERMVAAWAAVNSAGECEGGQMAASDRDNYMAEMAAQLAVARSAFTRAVIVMDATSPVLALWSFMSGCDRRKQRKYRRDWLDTWDHWLHSFEAVVFVWQTSHVGASINDWPDELAAEVAETGDIGGTGDIELQPGRYASLEVAAGGVDTLGGQIVKVGVRQWALRLLTREALRRLRATSKLTQVRGHDDLDLPRLSPALEDTAEQLLSARLQLGDARRLRGATARALLEAAEYCPFGCGCRFSWWDVAFVCKGAPLVAQRSAWLACAKEAQMALIGGLPHEQWQRLVALVEGSARPAAFEHREGSSQELAMRRLVGGCVVPPCDEKGEHQRGAEIMIAVSQAYEAGIRLQREAWEQAQWLRDLIATKTRELNRVRPLARRWRMTVIRGGPKRASMLSEAAAARTGLKAAVIAALQAGRLDDDEVVALLAAGEARIKEQLLIARASFTSVSHRAALREWLAMLRWWRLRAARARRGYVLEPTSAVVSDVLNWAATWLNGTCVHGSKRAVAEADVWIEFAGSSAHSRDGLAARAFSTRSKLRWCGGRRLFDKLKGIDVQSGHEPDRFGFWAVERLIRVRRPARRRGRQLEVLVQFAGLDPISKEPWPTEWIDIKLLKADLKRLAREMEEALMAAPPPARVSGCKRAWAGLFWEGADEGLPRRGRSGRAAGNAAASDVALDTGGARPVDAGGQAGSLVVVTALPLVGTRDVPAGGVPAGVAVAAAVPLGSRPWAAAYTCGRGGSEGRGRARWGTGRTKVMGW